MIADSFSTAFEVDKMICPQDTPEDYKRMFEGNINEWKREGKQHTNDCRHDLDFPTHYVPMMEKSVTVFAGMGEVIADLAEIYNLIIVSSTVTSPINKFLEKHNLIKYFVETLGNDIHHSKVEKIKMVFAKYKIGPGDCLFITDTLGDMLEAEKTGVDAIGVNWGFHSTETLMKGKPIKIVDTPDDLLVAIKGYFGKLKKEID